ncbi:MAG: small multi-drug export protein [Candidatus Nealsonbacteria bacterium]|nr:small multi-drug export protein [Candidatus Nealsonbacteria bacterium]
MNFNIGIEELNTFLIAMTPIGGLQAALPIALTVYNLSILSAYFFSVLGSLVPPIFILLTIGAFSQYLSQKSFFFNRFFQWLFNKTRTNHQKKIEKWKEWTLMIFVVVTGAWTGSLIAFVFNMPTKRALLFITLGVMIAGIIVTIFTLTGLLLYLHFGWQIFLGLLFLIGLILWYFKFKKKSR